MRFLLPLFCFIIDYFCFSLFNASLLLSLTGYFFLFLPDSMQRPALSCFTLFLLGLQSFMFYGICGLTFISLIPLALLEIYLNYLFIKTAVVGYTMLVTYIFGNNLLISLLKDQSIDLINYTIWQLCATMGVMLSLSLIIRVAGTTDNRL